MTEPIWQQQPGETGEAYAAFRCYYASHHRDIDQAWRRFHFTRHARPHPDEPNFLAPPHWHAWKTAHEWETRIQATDREQSQLDFEASEKAKGNSLSWSHERQEDYRDRLAIYRNLRRGLVKLTEQGELRDTITRTVTPNESGRPQVREETIRAVEQLKYLEREGPRLFPADNSKPTLPDGSSLFIDQDTVAELSPNPPPPPRDRYRPKTYSRFNHETNQEETWVA